MTYMEDLVKKLERKVESHWKYTCNLGIRIVKLEREFKIWKTEEYIEQENSKRIDNLSEVLNEFLYYYHNKGINWVYRDGETKQKDIMKMIKKLDGKPRGYKAIEGIGRKEKEAVRIGTLKWCKNYKEDFVMCQNQECGKCFSFEPKGMGCPKKHD